MTQKVIRVGNSLAVTLPQEFIRARKISAGQEIFVDADPQLDIVQIRTSTPVSHGLTPEFKFWLDKTTAKYQSLIKELAKK